MPPTATPSAFYWEVMTLPLEFAFTIAYGSQAVSRTVRVALSACPNIQPNTPPANNLITGWGEAVPSLFYGAETAESVCEFYQQLQADGFWQQHNLWNRQAIECALSAYPGHLAAKAGISIALYDWAGKALNLPLYALLGLDPKNTPKTCYTIGISSLAEVEHKTQLALTRGYDILKVKLGGENDRESLALIRRLAPGITLRADANAGWPAPIALERCKMLADFGVEFVEEPLTLDSPPAAYETLKATSPVLLMADESCHQLTDIPRCAEWFHAVNLKHTKTGSLTQIIQMIHAAKAHQLKVMLGGFAESSISVTAMAHLSPLVDYADLDACLLLAHDPYQGVCFEGSQILLPSAPGLGVTTRPKDA
ncbi:MAG: dipeptide epimerase [Candidatus Melainabacteria bacterium]|nr:dipeptide epimerase [Candidatus Melainabacteria bacterium]